jgi:hypothetical protein
MDADKLEELERLLKAATPGPWEIDGIGITHKSKPYGAPIDVCLMGEPAQYASVKPLMVPNYEANAALIVAAINALPELVARVRELERIETAARVYYENYLKDEADEDGVEMTGCSEHQHALAYDLRLALKGPTT